jgi:hypothetical protein
MCIVQYIEYVLEVIMRMAGGIVSDAYMRDLKCDVWDAGR